MGTALARKTILRKTSQLRSASSISQCRQITAIASERFAKSGHFRRYRELLARFRPPRRTARADPRIKIARSPSPSFILPNKRVHLRLGAKDSAEAITRSMNSNHILFENRDGEKPIPLANAHAHNARESVIINYHLRRQLIIAYIYIVRYHRR